MRYAYLRERLADEGIGEFSLASRAYDFSRTEHELSISETAILSTRVINETRFQYRRTNSQQDGDTTVPTLEVLESFIGGGPQVGLSFDEMDRVELRNTTSWISGSHSLKAGAHLEWLSLTDVSRSNFAGAFTFGGGLAPELDADDQLILGPGGLPVLTPVSSIERYRRTLLFQGQGKPPAEVRLLGGGPLQFSIMGGNPEERVSQVEFSGFIQDEWSLRPDFLLSMGLRYEAQTNLDDRLDFAPRLSFAWSPGAGPGDRPKTVIRGGSGIFFDRVSHQLTLAANRFNGISQQGFLITNPNFFPSVPSIGDLEAAAVPQTVRQIEEQLQSPYAIQTAISIEQQLPANFKLSASYINMRKLHVLRSRSETIPLADTALADVGRVYEYSSDGRINQNQLIVTLNSRLGRFGNLFGRYALSKANSNTDGPGTFPARGFDPSEYSRAGFDVRHRVGIGGTIRLPWYVQLNPLVIISTGAPFNITTGRDDNFDTVFTDRPAFASDLNKPGLIETPFGVFDPNPGPGQTLIPRNFGENPGLLLVNLRISRVFGFGSSPESQSSQGGDGAPRGGWAGGGHGQVSQGSVGAHPYNLTFSINVLNILNHTNLGPTIGNLTSPIFGTSNSTQFETHGGVGNRRVELQLRFSF